MGGCQGSSFDDVSKWPEKLRQNINILKPEEKGLAGMLLSLGQEHLFANWDNPGVNDHKKHDFFKRVNTLHTGYSVHGGLRAYVYRARELLQSSRLGLNPFDGWTPEVPAGVSLDSPFSEQYTRLEQIGLKEVGQCGFVLVAGGLGERLGYSSVKIGLPSETLTNTTYIQLYCKQILAIQKRYASAGKKVPLAIMVSDDTKSKTEELLKANRYFGLHASQVTIMKQEKVAALLDSDARLALSESDAYEIDAKPHGHGDVHSLMHSTGTAKKWLRSGINWVVFFQDTNGLGILTLPAMLGVSVEKNFQVNSLAIPRKAKQAVGALARLRHKDGRTMTVNVEYNQLDPLLRSTISPLGDVNDQTTGLSAFPGNINQLLFQLAPYVATLERTSGVMAEFVNPKYADDAKLRFRKPTRMECMMQDYPKILGRDAEVGFTTAPTWLCYSPCKNGAVEAAAMVAAGVPAGSASQAEADQYFVGAELLRLLGATVGRAAEQTHLGITVSLGPQIVLDPSFALFPCELKAKFVRPELVSISSRSALVVQGEGVVVESLRLDGALKVVASDGYIRNAGYEVKTSFTGQILSEFVAMRGYSLSRVSEDLAQASESDEAVTVVYAGPDRCDLECPCSCE